MNGDITGVVVVQLAIGRKAVSLKALSVVVYVLEGFGSTVDPHISKPRLSDLPDYPNTLLMKFIGFLVHLKWK